MEFMNITISMPVVLDQEASKQFKNKAKQASK